MELQKLQNYNMIALDYNVISFIDIFGQNEFSCKQALSNSFYLTSLMVF